MGRRSDTTAEGTRKALVGAALRVLLARGYEGTRVTEIAREAGVTPGALYNHFASKEDLLVAAISEQTPDMISQLLTSDSPSSVELLRMLGAMLPEKVSTMAPLVAELVSLSSRDDGVGTVVRREFAARESFIADLLRLAQQAGEVDTTIDADALGRFITMVALGANAASALGLDPIDNENWTTVINRMIDTITTVRT